MSLRAKPIVWDDVGYSMFRGYVQDGKGKRCVAEIDNHERKWRTTVKVSWTTLTILSTELHQAKSVAGRLLVQAVMLVVDES